MGIFSAAAQLFVKDSSRGWREADEDSNAPPQAKGMVPAIDDDPSYLELVRELLTAEGFKVLISPTGPKGLETLRHAPIQVVLLDYDMPKFDGAATLAFVHKLSPSRCSGSPVWH